MQKLSMFLTANGFLTAILLVWAQILQETYTREGGAYNPGLALVWTYSAVLVSLCAFGLTTSALAGERTSSVSKVASRRTQVQIPKVALGLFIGSFAMTIISVVQSLFNATYKLLYGLPALKPFKPHYWMLYVEVSYVVALVAISVLGVYHRCIWKVGYISLGILGIGVYIVQLSLQ